MPTKKKSKKKDLGRYRNRLEKYCGDTLTALGIPFDYEPQFTVLEGFNYPSMHFKSVPKNSLLVDITGKKTLPIRYKPDFVLHEHKVIIETKGFVRANDSFPLRWKLFMKYLMDNGMEDYRLFIPKSQKQVNQIIDIIKNGQ